MAFQRESDACQCLKSELDLFKKSPLQISQDKGYFIEHFTLSQTTGHGPIEFNVPGSDDLYIDLNNTFLRLNFKIVRSNGDDITNTDNVSAINLTLHTILSQVDIFLNDRMITDGNPNYAFRAYLETLLSHGGQAKSSQLQGSMFYKDTAGKMDELSDQNKGWIQRKKLSISGVQLFGKLHSDIFNQEKYLLNSVNMRIKCMRNSDNFVLMYAPGTGAGAKSYKYEISDVCLMVRKVRVAEVVKLAHERVLASGRQNVIYNINRVLTQVYSLHAGITNVVKDGLFQGAIPNRVVVGLVDAQAYNGNCEKNPFRFDHNDLLNVSLFVDEENVSPMNLNFGQNQYATAYLNLFQGTHSFGLDWGNDISFDEFAKGYGLFIFDTTADLSSMQSPRKKGNTKLSLKFRTPTSKVLCLLILAEFDNTIQITKERAIIVDYHT